LKKIQNRKPGTAKIDQIIFSSAKLTRIHQKNQNRKPGGEKIYYREPGTFLNCFLSYISLLLKLKRNVLASAGQRAKRAALR